MSRLKKPNDQNFVTVKMSWKLKHQLVQNEGGSGIRTESSTAPPKSTVSGVELFSFTITGLDLCQLRFVTAFRKLYYLVSIIVHISTTKKVTASNNMYRG